MKRIVLAAALIISTGVFTSCKKENNVNPASLYLKLAGVKKDLSSAD